MEATQFLDSDLCEEVPPPGIYVSTITTARQRSSQSGNAMIHVVHALEAVPPAFERVPEYFVLEGASARGLALSRRRLVELFRACGFTPRPGEDIAPAKAAASGSRSSTSSGAGSCICASSLTSRWPTSLTSPPLSDLTV